MWIQQRLSRGEWMAGILMFLFMLGVALGDQQIPRLGARLAMPLIVLAVAAAHLLRPRELAMVMTCCWGLALLAFAATLGVSAAYGDVLGGRVEDGVYFLVGQSFEVEVDRLTQRAVIALEAFVFPSGWSDSCSCSCWKVS